MTDRRLAEVEYFGALGGRVIRAVRLSLRESDDSADVLRGKLAGPASGACLTESEELCGKEIDDNALGGPRLMMGASVLYRRSDGIRGVPRMVNGIDDILSSICPAPWACGHSAHKISCARLVGGRLRILSAFSLCVSGTTTMVLIAYLVRY